RLAVKTAPNFDRLAAPREDCNPVEPFLPMIEHAISGRLDFGRRHGLIARLQFLEAGDVRLGFLKPFDEARHPGLDAVDVEGGDFHRLSMAGSVSPGKASDREARSATAARGRVRVFHLEGRSTERIDK